MVAVPGAIPVTKPVPDPTAATPGALLLQAPPVVASVKVSALPAQRADGRL